jgi:hypothetical protein
MCIICGAHVTNDPKTMQSHLQLQSIGSGASGPGDTTVPGLMPISAQDAWADSSAAKTAAKTADKSKSPPPAKKQRFEAAAAGQAKAEATWFHEAPSPAQLLQMLHILALRDVTSEASSRSVTEMTSSSSTASSTNRQWLADLAAALVVAADKRALAAVTTPTMARLLQAYGADGLRAPTRHRIRLASVHCPYELRGPLSVKTVVDCPSGIPLFRA